MFFFYEIKKKNDFKNRRNIFSIILTKMLDVLFFDKFQDDLEELCVIQSKPRGGDSFEKIRSSPVIVDQGEEGDIEEEGVQSEEECCEEMAPIPRPENGSIDEIDGISKVGPIVEETARRRRGPDESASFNTSDRKSKNCATFYFKHLDTDSEADCGMREEMHNGADDSSEEEWTYTASPPENYETRYEEKKSNVVVRLDFDEPSSIERNKNVDFKPIAIESKDEELKKNVILEEEVKLVEEENPGKKSPSLRNEKKQKSEGNDSENETKNDIQRLILEVEKLVREGQAGATRNLTPLIFEGHGHLEDYRAKYARIKEWLKLNSTHNHEEQSTASQVSRQQN